MKTMIDNNTAGSETKTGKINAFTLFGTAAVALMAVGSLSCGTVHGVGQDVETTGEVIRDVAR